MILVRIAAWVMIAAIAGEVLWCGMIAIGAANPPGTIDDVMHDPYYVIASTRHFFTIIPLALVGLVLCLVQTRKGEQTNKRAKIAAWLCLFSAVIITVALNWLTLKPLVFADLPRRYGDREMADQLVTAGWAYTAIGIGASMLVAAIMATIVDFILVRKAINTA